MNAADRSPGRPSRWLAGAVVALACLPARGQQHLVHGFEHAGGLKTSGKVTRVQGADVVTEGGSALQLWPGSAVTLTIPANVIGRTGWLKIDTFEVQPVLAPLQITVNGASRQGHVRPGRDVLAFPLGLAARTDPGPWPKKPVNLVMRNTGRQPVVVDNVRVTGPAAAPPGAILLDFGPADQAVWPGFEPAESQGTNIAWSGQGRIHAFSSQYPDPLLGDFAGLYPSVTTQERLTIRPADGASAGWVWLTHYGAQYSPALEYMVRLNNRSLLHRRLSPAQMLSADGLLQGKDQPWTTQWFEESFVPTIVTRLELSLGEGANSLDLANCQVAALIIAPRAQQQAMRGYVQQLQNDLKRYRRQFVLAAQHRPRCDVPPTEEESRAGVMLFQPPAEEWFSRHYTPAPEHRANSLKLTAAAGATITAALVAVPCEDGKSLQATLESLRDPAKGAIPAGSLHVSALAAVPVVRGGRVYYQPFLPMRNLHAVEALGVYWILLQVSVPARARPGSYQGALRVATGQGGAQLPVEVQVFGMQPVRLEDRRGVFGVLDDGDLYSVYRSLARVMPQQRRHQATREILLKLFAAGLNCGIVPGPDFSSVPDAAPDAMINGLRAYPAPSRPGKTLVDLRHGIWRLTSSPIQPGTALYTKAVQNLVGMSNQLAAKAGLDSYALYVHEAGSPSDLPEAARLAAAVRAAGGKPAVHTNAAILSRMAAGERAQLLKDLDALICVPNHTQLGAIREQLSQAGAAKSLLVSVRHADVYACGFYSWAVGADGVLARGIFSTWPPFNGFWFDGLSLLVPAPGGGFQPTLSLHEFGRGMEDYALATRCEALAKLAKTRGIGTHQLEEVLSEIRLTADSKIPRFDPETWRSRSVSAKQLQDWREALFRAAGEICRQLRR